MREPSPWLAQLIALPIGIAVAAIIAVLWFRITPLRDAMPTFSISAMFYAMPTFSIPALLFVFVLITVVHELIHAVVHPMTGRSPHTILGFWPSKALFYAHYDGELTRNHFVVILLMPLFVISFLPLMVATLVGTSSGWLAFASTLNALMACVDMLGAGMLLIQIPRTAIVRNQGWRTYWRKHETVAA
jgi:hypothetical protein